MLNDRPPICHLHPHAEFPCIGTYGASLARLARSCHGPVIICPLLPRHAKLWLFYLFPIDRALQQVPEVCIPFLGFLESDVNFGRQCRHPKHNFLSREPVAEPQRRETCYEVQNGGNEDREDEQIEQDVPE